MLLRLPRRRKMGSQLRTIVHVPSALRDSESPLVNDESLIRAMILRVRERIGMMERRDPESPLALVCLIARG
jgi:hypothetical protein